MPPSQRTRKRCRPTHTDTKRRYHILPYTYKRAKELGVKVEQSDKPKYKLRVTTKQGRVVYCGARGYNDFPTYIKNCGMPYARTRRRLYRIRHKKDRGVAGTAGYYADRLLW